jgi:two-component system, NtrC family, response regulator AtoC
LSTVESTQLPLRRKGKVLFVDDELDLRRVISGGLEQRGFEIAQAESAEVALAMLESARFDLVLTEVRLRGLDGLELGRRAIESWMLPVVLLTAGPTVETAVATVRARLDDVLQKPVDLDTLALALERTIERSKTKNGVKRLPERGANNGYFEEMIGESRVIRALQELIVKVAPGHACAVITGETGTGKELVAHALHDRSPRAGGPFVAINCAAMPPMLLESELFGHARGAFTDAVSAKRGLLLDANGGTVFLDEIGDMPSEMQVKLLRALQERKVRPVGGTEEVPFDARIIAATHSDLARQVEAGRFRRDLYYRINVVQLPIPPLRARGRDVLLLADHFIERASERSGRRLPRLSRQASEKLLSYDWPGNVRELENCIQTATTLTRFRQIKVQDLPAPVLRHKAPVSFQEQALDELPSMDEVERRHLVMVLKALDGNKSRAAKALGFDRRTLYRKLERYGFSTR